jgi:hypothetical protein
LVDLGGTHFAACHHADQVTKDQGIWERMEAERLLTANMSST